MRSGWAGSVFDYGGWSWREEGDSDISQPLNHPGSILGGLIPRPFKNYLGILFEVAGGEQGDSGGILALHGGGLLF